MVACAERLQSRDFGVNKRLSLVNRDAAPARDIEIEVHPVLGDLPFGHLLEEQAGSDAVRILRSSGVVPPFLGDAFGRMGAELADSLRRPRLSYNVAIYHRARGATAGEQSLAAAGRA